MLRAFGACLEEAYAAPQDRRNGQFSGVERRPLNPAPSFLLRTLSFHRNFSEGESRPQDVSKGAKVVAGKL